MMMMIKKKILSIQDIIQTANFFFHICLLEINYLGLLLTTNEIRAQKGIVFSVTRKTFQLEPLPNELRGYGISLKMALIWQTRQSRLHQGASQPGVLEFNLKLDGRPLAGI